MSVSYCPLHARLWSARKNGWIDFPLEKIAGIQSLYRLFKEGHIDTPEYLVIEKACDRCEATAKKNDPSEEDGLTGAFHCYF